MFLVTQENPKQHTLRFLDGMRGLAAFYVLLHHAEWVLFSGYSAFFFEKYRQFSLIGKLHLLFSRACEYGHEAVIFFFILSGFVIHYRYSKELADESKKAEFHWFFYFKRRCRRLYPPLIFSMILTFVLDQIAIVRHFPFYFDSTMHHTVGRYDLLTAMGNLAFLMGTYVRVWGTNSPLWSLKYEWWFYMFYPFFWKLSQKSVKLATLIMALCFAVVFISHWPIRLLQDVFRYMLLWWFGVLLADVYTCRINIPYRAISWLSVLLVFLPFRRLDSTLHDYLIALGFVGLLAMCFYAKSNGKTLRPLEKLSLLGDMSYTLYIIQLPILVFISDWIRLDSPYHVLPNYFGWDLLGILVCLIISYFSHFLTEKPFVRKHVPAIARA